MYLLSHIDPETYSLPFPIIIPLLILLLLPMYPFLPSSVDQKLTHPSKPNTDASSPLKVFIIHSGSSTIVNINVCLAFFLAKRDPISVPMTLPLPLVSYLHWAACCSIQALRHNSQYLCGFTETRFQTPAFLAANWNG